MDPALALDLGGTKVEAALVTADGAVVAGSRHRRPTGPTATSADLAQAVTDVVTAALAPVGGAVAGIGIGSAGPIDRPAGAASPLNLPVWRGFPLRDHVADVARALGLPPAAPVRLEMDGICIALAEHWLGAARGSDDVMGMIVSTGIGGGLILGGRVVPGPTGNAGHVGHIAAAGHDEPCPCGGRGCVEAVASGPSSVRWARAQGWGGSTGEDLAAGVAAGDPIALAAVERAGRALGSALASATALVDVEVIAIGGGFSRVSPDLLDIVRDEIARHAGFGFVTKVRVVPSGLGDEGPLVGAAALVHRPELLAG